MLFLPFLFRISIVAAQELADKNGLQKVREISNVIRGKARVENSNQGKKTVVEFSVLWLPMI